MVTMDLEEEACLKEKEKAKGPRAEDAEVERAREEAGERDWRRRLSTGETLVERLILFYVKKEERRRRKKKEDFHVSFFRFGQLSAFWRFFPLFLAACQIFPIYPPPRSSSQSTRSAKE